MGAEGRRVVVDVRRTGWCESRANNGLLLSSIRLLASRTVVGIFINQPIFSTTTDHTNHPPCPFIQLCD
jgi:hypothetical protein